jgi:fatty-acyl-CoA synthase
MIVSLDAASNEVPAIADWLAPPGVRHDPPRRRNEDMAAVIPTGGTTGASKGVLQSNRGFEAYAMQHMLAMPHNAPPRFLAATPMTHAAGAMAFPMLARGGTIFIQASAKPLDVAEALVKHAITDIFLPPTVIYMMLADPQVRAMRFPALRYLLYGAAPMGASKLRDALEWLGPVLAQGYGQTEAIAICTFMAPADHYVGGIPGGEIENEHRLSSCGRATPLTDVQIMDEAGQLLTDGEPGEIVVRSSLVMTGYDDDVEATREAQAFGWHHTGDIGYRDRDGYFYIIDRLRDMIISGGVNIFPSEIEQVLWSHPGITDCAVVGAPDEKWGEVVTAVIEAKPGVTLDPNDVLDFCRTRLNSIKAPKSVLVWRELPRSPIGKVLKREVRDLLWRDHSRRV